MADQENDVEYWLRRLDSANPRERVNSLRSIAGRPIADLRLLAACERLLADRTMTALSLPYSFGEVRWCAADAVVAVREALAISEPVVLTDAFAPCSTTQIGDLARTTGLPASPGGIDGDLRTLEMLAMMGLLPRQMVKRTPTVSGSRE